MGVLLTLFLAMLKIGCLAFGGGYTIIALLEKEFISKRNWINHDEFLDVVSIAESTPGPIAINVATYIGYKQKGVVGAIVATVAMCLPSFFFMYVVSLLYEYFVELTIVSAAFKGVQICVIYFIASAGIKMFQKMKKNVFNLSVFLITCVGMIACSLFHYYISAVAFLFTAGAVGLVIFFMKAKKAKGEDKQ